MTGLSCAPPRYARNVQTLISASETKAVKAGWPIGGANSRFGRLSSHQLQLSKPELSRNVSKCALIDAQSRRHRRAVSNLLSIFELTCRFSASVGIATWRAAAEDSCFTLSAALRGRLARPLQRDSRAGRLAGVDVDEIAEIVPTKEHRTNYV